MLRACYSLVASLFLFIDTQAIAVALLLGDNEGVLFILGDNFCEIDDDFCLDRFPGKTIHDWRCEKAKIINWRQ